MKKIALVALAAALFVAPAPAMADNTDNGPAQPGGQNNTVQYGQGRYLHTFSNISMDIPAFCTSVTASDVSFGSTANALSPSAVLPLVVSYQCVDTVKPVIAFESSTNKCHLVSDVAKNQNSDAANGIPYSIKSSQASTTELCNADSSAPPSLYYPTTTDTTKSHTFYVSTGVLTGGGYATFPVGTYTDQVQIYLSF